MTACILSWDTAQPKYSSNDGQNSAHQPISGRLHKPLPSSLLILQQIASPISRMNYLALFAQGLDGDSVEEQL